MCNGTQGMPGTKESQHTWNFIWNLCAEKKKSSLGWCRVWKADSVIWKMFKNGTPLLKTDTALKQKLDFGLLIIFVELYSGCILKHRRQPHFAALHTVFSPILSVGFVEGT